MYGYIYKTTNTLTNKIYVGQKKSTYFLHEKYFGSGQIIKSIIKKYGKTNLTVEMIDTDESKLKNSLSCKGRITWNKGISKNII